MPLDHGNYEAIGKESFFMNIKQSTYAEKIYQEIDTTPEEYLPALLDIVRSFRLTCSGAQLKNSKVSVDAYIGFKHRQSFKVTMSS